MSVVNKATCLCPPGKEHSCNSFRCPRVVNTDAESGWAAFELTAKTYELEIANETIERLIAQRDAAQERAEAAEREREAFRDSYQAAVRRAELELVPAIEAALRERDQAREALEKANRRLAENGDL